MKKIIFLVLFLVVSSKIAYSKQVMDNGTHSVYSNKITLNEKIVGLSKLWSEIKYNFVNIDQVSFDVDSLYSEYIERVVNSKDDIAYYDILQRFTACFNDSHTEVFRSPYSWNEYNKLLIVSK